MVAETGPFSIGEMPWVFRPDGTGRAKPMGPRFYQELDEDFGSFAGHILIQRFAFSEDWPTWEMHPEGDEFIYLLEGDTDLLIWENGAARCVRASEPGTYVVVPQGAWHTARPHAPTAMLFVTPGNGTLNAERPGEV